MEVVVYWGSVYCEGKGRVLWFVFFNSCLVSLASGWFLDAV